MLNARIPRDGDGLTLEDAWEGGNDWPVLPHHILFECAKGYALFHAPGIHKVGLENFQSIENYLNQHTFELEAFLPFSSYKDAVTQIKAISNSLVTPQLQNFLMDFLKQPKTGESIHSIAVVDPFLGLSIADQTRLASESNILFDDATRGLRLKIHEFIGMTRGELENAQVNLARRLYISPKRTETRILVPSSSSQQQVVRVVPHRFDGVFNIEGIENMLCAINLVPGEVLYGEELVRVQNVEDGTEAEVEYRVWNPHRSKLGAAILCGVTNTWIKPGARVLYIGDVCGLTFADLSDLVGPDGLVYVVGLSDDVVDMAGKRPNVVTIIEKPSMHWKYRMLVGMVDVIFAEIDQLHVMKTILNNAHSYLRAGGHYLIFARANDIDSVGQVNNLLAQHDYKKEFKPIETVMLDLVDGAYELAVGGYRMLEE